MTRPAATPWRLYLLVTVPGIIMVGATSYLLHTGHRANTRHLPLIRAAVEIQLQATTAHLWFEEILSGDRHENMEDVWRHLDSADRCAAAMLDGGEHLDTFISPLDDPTLRGEIESVRRKLAEFRRITQERWEARRVSAAGTGIDQRYDEIFEEFVSLAEHVENGVRRQIGHDLRLMQRIQVSFIAGIVLLMVFVGLVVARHIEQRRRAERRLRRSEEELRLTFDATPIAIAILDGTGAFLRVNPACCDMLGYTRDELRRLRLEDLAHPGDVDPGKVLADTLLRGDATSDEVTSRYVRKDGTVLHGLIHARRIVGVDGVPVIVGQILDRTKEIVAEEEARQHRERLAHVVRVTTMGEMASGIAHEINQPLTAISAFAQACQRLLRDDGIDSAELSETLGRVGDQARRAGEVIRRLRSFVSGRDRERERVAVNDLVRDTIQLLNPDVGRHGDRVVLDLADGLPELVVDSVQIQQVLLNLVRNGLEAMQGRDGPGDVLTVRTSMEGTDVSIRVVDRGVGLPPETAERLFEPFHTTKPSGMGLGLSISRSIVTAHGGRIWFTRNEDRGTTFHLTLPTTLRADDV